MTGNENTSDRALAAIERDKRRKKKLAKKVGVENREIKAICETFATEAGQRTLFWLMRECGYQMPSVVVDQENGEVKKESTVFNEARRSVYLNLRDQLKTRPDILSNVEIYHLKGGK